MERKNKYCVWSFIGNNQPSVFRYNQELEDGNMLAKKMTRDRDIYYCTEQEYGKYGESLGPCASGVKFVLESLAKD